MNAPLTTAQQESAYLVVEGTGVGGRLRAGHGVVGSGNERRAAVQAAIEGHGIAYAPEDLVAAPLQVGRLVAVLEEWSPHFPGYFLYYPSRSQNVPAFTTIVNALRIR